MGKGVFLVAVFAFICTALAEKMLLPILKKAKIGQHILTIGPAWHGEKEGTPTMGGLAFLTVGSLTALALVFLSAAPFEGGPDPELAICIFYSVLGGFIGVADDLTKMLKRENGGLSAGVKFLLQCIAAAAFLLLLSVSGLLSTSLLLPFKSTPLELGRLYFPLALLFLVGFSNAVNLTDGLDGLCSSVSAAALLFFVALGLTLGLRSVTLFSLVLLGCVLAFLLFNRHPAKVFMGDTGSLFLGSALGALALVSGRAVLFFLVGGVYLFEAVSVILQVLFFKATKGKRLFLMAPFHHHLERKGWKENSVVIAFVSVTLVLSALAYMLI